MKLIFNNKKEEEFFFVKTKNIARVIIFISASEKSKEIEIERAESVCVCGKLSRWSEYNYTLTYQLKHTFTLVYICQKEKEKEQKYAYTPAPSKYQQANKKVTHALHISISIKNKGLIKLTHKQTNIQFKLNNFNASNFFLQYSVSEMNISI